MTNWDNPATANSIIQDDGNQQLSSDVFFSHLPTTVANSKTGGRTTLLSSLPSNTQVMGLGGHLKSTEIFTPAQSRVIQICATVFATISVVSTLIALYQLLMLKRNYRRSLILLLVLGDFFKSVWFLVFASVSLSVNGIDTASAFCQGNGFLLQAAQEACDAAIFFMSLHMYLQIFHSSSKIFGHDGLYRFRHTVGALYVLLPTLSASLAFINPVDGYISQGPFCTLPIRPFWYRLALTWIPRYLILCFILFVALRIYLHVGKGFKVFARQQDRASSDDTGHTTGLTTEDVATVTEMPHVKKKSATNSFWSDDQQDGTKVAPSPNASTSTTADTEGQMSGVINWTPSFAVVSDNEQLPAAAAGSRRGSRVAFQIDGETHPELLHVPADQRRTRGSVSTLGSSRSNGELSTDGTWPSTLEPITESRTAENQNADDMDIESADTPLKKRRRAIQRQLRLLFIYPSVYMIMWALPFAYHAMNYSNYYAQHPIYGLAISAIISQLALATCDCIVFGWREKPWKHTPGSDGTFMGSFMFWRHHRGLGFSVSTGAPSRIPRGSQSHHSTAEQQPEEQRERGPISRLSAHLAMHGGMNPVARMHKKTWSGSSERTRVAAERAAERLALERADRENNQLPPSQDALLGVKSRPVTEWWDRRLSAAVLGAGDEDDLDHLH